MIAKFLANGAAKYNSITALIFPDILFSDPHDQLETRQARYAIAATH